MTKEELKDKYSAFIAEISEIMGLGKPIDILKLCATTDLFFRPLENRITDLEKENAELKGLKDVATLIRANNDTVITLMQLNNMIVSKSQQLTKAKELLERLLITSCNSDVLNLLPNCSEVLRIRVEAEQFLKDSEVEK